MKKVLEVDVRFDMKGFIDYYNLFLQKLNWLIQTNM
jgi:hypothetical protein